MVSSRQLRDAVTLTRALDGVRDARALDALVGDALPRIVTGRRSQLDEDELALLELLRSPLLAATQRVAARERRLGAGLTPREQEVLDWVEAGDSNQSIARRLGVRPRTVDKHLEHVYAKLGVCSRTAALAHVRGIAH